MPMADLLLADDSCERQRVRGPHRRLRQLATADWDGADSIIVYMQLALGYT